MKEVNLEFLQKFSKITVKGICRKKGIDSANIYTGRASENTIEIVRNEIEKELNNIYREERMMLNDKNI